MAYAVAKDNKPLVDALNSGLDAVIADGTWAKLYCQWVPRTLPPGWKPGSKAAPAPNLPDFAAIAANQHRAAAGGPGRAEVGAGPVARLLLRLGYVPTSHPHTVDHGVAQHVDPDQQRRSSSGWRLAWCWRWRESRIALAALAGAGVHRYLPRSSRGGDHPDHRTGHRAVGRRADEQQSLPAWALPHWG